MTDNTPHIERIALRPEEAAEALGVHKDTVYKLIDAGVLPAHRLGRRLVLLVDELREAVRGL